jgi:hypothetical protein
MLFHWIPLLLVTLWIHLPVVSTKKLWVWTYKSPNIGVKNFSAVGPIAGFHKSLNIEHCIFTSGRYNTEVINSAPFFSSHFVSSHARSRGSKSLRRRRQLPVSKCTSGKHRPKRNATRSCPCTKSVRIVDLKPEDVIILTYMFSWITILG